MAYPLTAADRTALEFVINEAGGGGSFKGEDGTPAREYRFSFTTGADAQVVDRSGGRGQAAGTTVPHRGDETAPAAGRPIHIDPDNPPIAAIRALLEDAFTPEKLRRFCQDRPQFADLITHFGPGHGLDNMVDEVIDYCRVLLLWDELLAEVAKVNPNQYARHEARLRGAATPAALRVEPAKPAPAADLASLRCRLGQAFDDPGLDAFCLDYFPEVYDRFSRGMRKDEKITQLLDHCRRKAGDLDRLAALLAGSA